MELSTVRQELPLTKAELKTLFYVGRKLELIACCLPMSAPSERTVCAQRYYGYDMLRADGRVSTLRFETGNKIIGVSDAGNGFTEVKIVDEDGKVAAHYRLL
jgi:hypothetical protein